MQNDDILKAFCMFKTIMNQNKNSNSFFFLSNMHHSFSKLERIYIIIMKKENALEIGEIDSKTHLSKFVSNVFLTLKIKNFKNVSLTKVIQFYII
jgi:hypothetical protein